MATKTLVRPGELLAEELEARGISQRDLAIAIGRAPTVISSVIRGRRRIDAAFALALERAWGTPAQVWMNLQSHYDLALEREKQAS